MGRYGTAGQATEGGRIRRMCFAYSMAKVTNTHSEYVMPVTENFVYYAYSQSKHPTCECFSSSPNIVIKSRRMRWAGHLARMGEERGVYRVLVGKPEGTLSLRET